MAADAALIRQSIAAASLFSLKIIPYFILLIKIRPGYFRSAESQRKREDVPYDHSLCFRHFIFAV